MAAKMPPGKQVSPAQLGCNKTVACHLPVTTKSPFLRRKPHLVLQNKVAAANSCLYQHRARYR